MNLKQLRHSAKTFYLASERCHEDRPLSGNRYESLTEPGIVCAALSIELGMKFLILKAGRTSRGHNLRNLFSALSKDQQSFLISRIGLPKGVFHKRLDAIANAFIEWRYLFEGKASSIPTMFMSKLAKALLEAK